MSAIWWAAEDYEFYPVPQMSTSSANVAYRSAFARGTMASPSQNMYCKSNTFGPVTNCWFGFRVYLYSLWGENRWAGLGMKGSSNALVVGFGSNSSAIALWKAVSGSWTNIAESVSGLVVSGVGSAIGFNKIDVNITDWGASATVVVYLNGRPVITFNGDPRPAGISGFDCFWLIGDGGGNYGRISEPIVADEDTRLMSVFNMALTGAGSNPNLAEWTGAYTDINEVTYNEATALYVNADAKHADYALTDPPAGSYTVVGEKLAAVAVCAPNSTATKLALSRANAGTVDAGSLVAVSAGPNICERYVASPPAFADLAAEQLRLTSGA